MAYLTKQKTIELINNRPQGTTPESILSGLVARGYRIEGMPQDVSSMTRSDLTPAEKMQRDTTTAAKFIGSEPLARGIGQTIANATGTQDVVNKSQEGLVQSVGQIQKLIKDKKARGEDVARLEKTLGVLHQELGQATSDVMQSGTSGLSNQQVVGSAIQTAANFIPSVSKGASLASKVGAGAATGYTYDVGGNLQDNKSIKQSLTPGIGTAIGAILPIIGKVTGLSDSAKTAKNASNKLEEVNLRLSPKDRTMVQNNGKDIVNYLSEKKITGNPSERYDKITQIYDDFEKKIGETIKTSGFNVSKNDLISKISDLPKQFVDEPLLSQEVQNLSDKYIAILQKNQGDVISGEVINKFKRELDRAAFSKAGDVIVNDSKFALADLLRDELNNGIPKLKVANNEYSKIILARKLMAKAIGRNQLGFTGKIISSVSGGLLGSVAGGPVGAAIGASVGPETAKVVAGTKARSILGSGLQTLSKKLEKLPTDSAGKISKKVLLNLVQESQ